MHLALVVLAVITVAANAVSHNKDKFNRELVDPHPTSRATTSVDETSGNKISVSVKSATDTKATSPSPQPAASSYQYPGSVPISQNQYESSDDPDTITNWYKEAIRNDGFNVKNFVQTTVNGVTENKLSGSSSNKEIAITITKSQGQNTKISIK